MYLYFTCKYIFQLSHHLKLIKEFLHLVISHLQVVRTVIGIKITIKNFMLWFHYLCQMSYINHELRYSWACVNMHHNRDHEAFIEICNSRLNFHKHLRIQARTQLCERMTGAVVLSERQDKCVTHMCILMHYRPLAFRGKDCSECTKSASKPAKFLSWQKQLLSSAVQGLLHFPEGGSVFD